ncbi:predicted protein [Nematostella vectensis]|uniref:Protein disulfide-isomerase n=1 Tax=Nematostella vectensis TaxID=45351 RepID=A7STM8_NEMVE|nr:predicted protein [Nematostella vectensis]|eukprot:XP_001625030.1 predicted protein [Nematostella vectensis]
MARSKTLIAISLLALVAFAYLGYAEEILEDKETEDSDPGAENDDEQEKNDADDSDEVKEEDDVLVLNSKNFDRVIEENNIILVEFYAPWCGHCKSLAPEYAKAAKKMKLNDPPVPFAKMDATVASDIAQRFDVSGYPTLKIFRKGTPYEYEGPREESGIVEYMKKQSDPNWKPPPVAALTLTKENFTEVVNRESLMLVEFFAPWCGHCKQLAPEYEKAAQELQKNDPPIPLAIVDATIESELAQKYEVQGYPTLKVFRKGKATEYKGQRDQYGIASYMRSQVGPSSRILSSLKAVQDFMKEKDDVTIMGFFDGEDDKMLESYLEANNDVRDDYPFAHTFDAAAKKHFGIKKSSIVLFQPERFLSKYEPKHFVYEGKDLSPAALQGFYKDKRVPLVGLYTSYDKDKKYAARPLCIVYYGVDFGFDNRVATQFWRSKVIEVAKDHRDITFAIANEEESEQELKDFGLAESGEEVNVGCFDKEGRKFRMDPDEEEFSEDSLREFVEEFKAGNLKPIIKSQPVPKSNKEPVTVVVGKTFDEIVNDPKKDVLIEFYAPWCGHCKALEPTFKKLGKHFRNDKNIVIAKIDATANDVPSTYAVEGFPTIYFATSKDKKNPIKFDGGRELKDLIKFVEEKATVSLSKEKAKDEL